MLLFIRDSEHQVGRAALSSDPLASLFVLCLFTGVTFARFLLFALKLSPNPGGQSDLFQLEVEFKKKR